MATQKCPNCSSQTLSLYRCPACGDTRCASSTCKGSSQKKLGRGAENVTCHSCGREKYEKMK